MIIYDNFKELVKERADFAVELLDTYKIGEWMNDEIYCYEDLEDYADHELKEGQYASFFENTSRDFNGAPDPFDYIDLKELGEDLAGCWNESGNYRASTDEVLSTDYGWGKTKFFIK